MSRQTPIIALLAAGLTLGGCAADTPSPIGDPQAGAIVIERASCGSCHLITGIALADGRVGPSLAAFGRQRVIAGTLANTAPNLVLWLKHPQQVRPGNLMPELGLTDGQARDAAAYLEALR